MRKIWFLLLAIFLTGCEPRPNQSLVTYGSSNPVQDARLVAGASSVYSIAYTGSMEPFLTGGDVVVVDRSFSYDDLKTGDICLYVPSPTQLRSYLGLSQGIPICHMLAARSGDEWIVDGIANRVYENGSLRMNRNTYLGKVTRVFTHRTAK